MSEDHSSLVVGIAINHICPPRPTSGTQQHHLVRRLQLATSRPSAAFESVKHILQIPSAHPLLVPSGVPIKAISSPTTDSSANPIEQGRKLVTVAKCTVILATSCKLGHPDSTLPSSPSSLEC